MEAERSLFLSLAFMATLVAPAGAQLSTEEELAEPTPLPALNSVWIEELNWMEVRDAVAAGKTTAIIPTGGIEQNGRYVALGKHNYILEVACEDIARKLGNALCAPIIKLVPEGDIDPPSSHMRYPGTISLREETFEAVLDDVASSLAAHGFTDIVFIGDSGRNQDGQEAVAEALNARWSHARAHHIAEYYDNDGTIAHMEETFGIVEVDDGYHDSYWITTLMMVNDPSVVRYDERVKAGLTDTNGVDISPEEKSIEIGQELMRWRVEQTVGAIRRSIEGS
jgi:creatinine amidohydrolase/Fe(II)-dependent formamide hydrolase-like protein